MALLRMLPKINEEVENIIVTIEKEGSLAAEFRKRGIEVIALNQKNYYNPISYIQLAKKIKSLHPDLLITHLFHADVIGRLIIQWVLPCRTISSLVTTYNFDTYWFPRLFEKTTRYLCDGYMANAQSVKQAYVEKFGVAEKKITVLPCAMDLELFTSLESSQELKNSLGITDEDFVIICVANLHVNKGHTYLLTAFESFFQKNKTGKLLLVGQGQEKENLQRQVSSYLSKNNIFFLGQRSDVPKLLRISSIFVLPTFFEGMSNAIMEAMASGLPVITTDIPENRELITDQKTGLLCPTKNAQAINKAIERLFQNPHERALLSKNALNLMETTYSLPHVTSQWIAFYKKSAQKI